MSTNTQPDVYGNLVKPGRAGVFGMSLGTTIAAVPIVLILIGFMVQHRYLLGVLTLVIGTVALVLTVIRGRDGRNFYERASLRLAHAYKVQMGYGLYLAGPAGKVKDGTMKLPGLMASSEISDHLAAYDIPFGMIRLVGAGHYTVVLECYPDGDSLIDTDRVNSMVAHWGAWLAELGRDDGVIGVAVSVESAPDTGLRLRTMVNNNMVENAPRFAQEVAAEIPGQISAGAPSLTTRIAITFTGRALGREGKDRGVDAMADEIGTRLPVLISGLSLTGVGTSVYVCTKQDIIDFTRSAYDPTVAAQIEEARTSPEGTGLSWDEAGPMFADDRKLDRYFHDRAVSKSWTMREGPHGQFQATALRGLMAPTKDVLRKRVTLLYRPVPAGRATEVVQSDVNNAAFVQSQRRRPTARQLQRRAFAEKSASEEAQGAGLTRFGMIITVTLANDENFPTLEKTIPALGTQARLRLRETLGNQAVYFQAGLPLGLVLAEHSMVPQGMKGL